MTRCPETLEPERESRLRDVQRFLADNPVVVLVGRPRAAVRRSRISSTGTRSASRSSPGTSSRRRSSFAAPLAMIAAGQTLVMLTGGVDLSVALTATAAAFATSWQGGNGTARGHRRRPCRRRRHRPRERHRRRRLPRQPADHDPRHVLGYVRAAVDLCGHAGSRRSFPACVSTLGSDRFFDYMPVRTCSSGSPIAAVIILGLRYTGYGRMIYAVGDNEVAAGWPASASGRCSSSSTRSAALFSALGGVLLVGFTRQPRPRPRERRTCCTSVAAVVIGGTSIFGGWGSYSGTIVGVLILTVLGSLLTMLDAEEWRRSRSSTARSSSCWPRSTPARPAAIDPARRPDGRPRVSVDLYPEQVGVPLARRAHVPEDARRLADERRRRGRAARASRRA